VRFAAVDFDLDVVVVLGKGCRDRAVPFGARPQGRSTATPAPGPAQGRRVGDAGVRAHGSLTDWGVGQLVL
jgi:hypothetical protein